ncbi:MAG: hypothetical protein ACYTEX_28360 [Planctomycetota bacterium]|jgi:hypothetical protein
MSKLLQHMGPNMRDVFGVSDDFLNFPTNTTLAAVNSTGHWIVVASNSGSVADTDAAGGVIKINPSDATEADNDETYLHSVTECFKFADGKPLVFEARVRCVSNVPATGPNVIVGLKDAVAADSILDNGGGPAASYSGAVFFRKDGDTTWWCESSIGSSQTTVDSNITATNNTWHTLRIEVRDKTSTVQEVHFFIDDVECGHDVTTSPGNKICQTINPTSATEMQICLGAKNGYASNTQYANVDYVECWQKR